MLTIIQQLCSMKRLKHTKYTQINTNKSTHSEMDPVWQNAIQRTVRTAHLSVLLTVHSFSTQYNTTVLIIFLTRGTLLLEVLLEVIYLQINIIVQMLSIGEEGGHNGTKPHMGFRLVSKSVTLNDLEYVMTADARYLCGSWASCTF